MDTLHTLQEQITAIIDSGDINTLTLRDVNTQLKDVYGVDIIKHKQDIRNIIDDILSKMDCEDD